MFQLSNYTDYVFSEDERSGFKVAFPIYVVSVLCLVAMFIYARRLNPNHGQYFYFVGCLVIISVSIPLIIGLFYKKYRFARFSFSNQSVSVQFGKTTRTIYASDSFYVCSAKMLYGQRYQNVEVKLIAIWKEGTKAPIEEISPYIALRKFDVILLPYEDTILRLLDESLGVKEVYDYPDQILICKQNQNNNNIL